MNVGELKKALSLLPDDLEVILARDPEGNGFHPLYEVEEAYIVTNGDKHGYIDGVIGDDDADEYDEDELESRLVFWP